MKKYLCSPRAHVILLLVSSLCSPAFAAGVQVEQVGSSAIEAQGSSESKILNTAKTPDLGFTPAAEIPDPVARKDTDYQKSILENNYMTPYGRAEAATDDENSNAVISPATDNNTKLPEKKTKTDQLLQKEKKYRQAHRTTPDAPVQGAVAPEPKMKELEIGQ